MNRITARLRGSADYRRALLDVREEYDRYRDEAQAHVQLTDGVIAQLRTELADERDENAVGSLAQLAMVWQQRCEKAKAEVERLRLAVMHHEQRDAMRDTDERETDSTYQEEVDARDNEIDDLRHQLAQAKNQLAEVGRRSEPVFHGQPPIRGVLPPSIQALVDWHLREPLTAVISLPTRDSVRAALAAYSVAPGMCEKCGHRPVWRPELAGQQFFGHFCEPCISDCHENPSDHMCRIDRWQPEAARSQT